MIIPYLLSGVFCFVLDEMLTQHEYEHYSSSSKSCYSSDTNATVSVVQRYLTNVVPTTTTTRVQTSPPEIKVECATREFMQQHFNDVNQQ